VTGKELLKNLKQGRRVYGTLIVSTSPKWPEAVKNSGVDFVFIDTEHIPIERNMLSWMCQSYNGLNLAPIVRIPSPDPFEACKVLDGGANGVIAPYIESAEQVKKLVGATKFRPLKGKLLESALNGSEELSSGVKKYLDHCNSGKLLIVNIESVPAINNLDEILKVPGLDAVLIGPHDLSVSLGVPEQYHSKIFNDAVCSIIEKARRYNIAAGFHFWKSLELESNWIKAGANLIIHSGDITIFSEKLKEDLKKMRKQFKDDDKNHNLEKTIIV
jgi:2-keto-3-deoxy-L-rhamnonate aldolase RhmA